MFVLCVLYVCVCVCCVVCALCLCVLCVCVCMCVCGLMLGACDYVKSLKISEKLMDQFVANDVLS